MAHLGTKYGVSNAVRRVLYFYAEFYDPTRRPKRKRVSLKTRDKRVAIQKFATIDREVAMGLWDPWQDSRVDEGITAGSAVTRFLRSRERHCGAPTVATYGYVLNPFTLSLAPGFPLRAVEERHVDSFLSRELADATRTNYAHRLRIFFTWCIEEGYLRHNPAPRRKETKKTRRLDFPEFLSEVELNELLTTIDADSIVRADACDNQWLRDAVEFAVYTGLRRAELCNLQWRHVDLTSHFLTVANTESFTTKSGRERRVPLTQTPLCIADRLNGERGSEDKYDYVLKGAGGGRLNGNYLGKRFRHFRRQAELPEGINFHTLRHTFASWAAQRGMNLYSLKEIMGHADIKQTQVYASLNPATLQREMEKVFGSPSAPPGL